MGYKDVKCKTKICTDSMLISLREVLSWKNYIKSNFSALYKLVVFKTLG